jgi:hypothetical protein
MCSVPHVRELCPRPSVFKDYNFDDNAFPHLLLAKGNTNMNATHNEIEDWFNRNTFDLADGLSWPRALFLFHDFLPLAQR